MWRHCQCIIIWKWHWKCPNSVCGKMDHKTVLTSQGLRVQLEEQVRAKDVELNQLKSVRLDLDKDLRDCRQTISQVSRELLMCCLHRCGTPWWISQVSRVLLVCCLHRCGTPWWSLLICVILTLIILSDQYREIFNFANDADSQSNPGWDKCLFVYVIWMKSQPTLKPIVQAVGVCNFTGHWEVTRMTLVLNNLSNMLGSWRAFPESVWPSKNSPDEMQQRQLSRTHSK